MSILLCLLTLIAWSSEPASPASPASPAPPLDAVLVPALPREVAPPLPPPGPAHERSAALRAEGQPRQAIVALGRLDDPRAHLERAYALRDLGRKDTALAEVDASLRKIRSVEAWMLRARLAGESGDVQGASHALDRVAALSHDAKIVEGLVSLSRMLTGTERTRLALLRWTELHPTAVLYRELAQDHLDLDELPEAARAIERADTLLTSPEILLLKATIEEARAQHAAAYKSRRLALSEARHRVQARPDDVQAQIWLKRCQDALQDNSQL
jgi:tetratricopeptide (TPR) repeat protein